jgi:signal peptidase II
MAASRYNHTLVIFACIILIGLLVFADQYTKWLVLEKLLNNKDAVLPFAEWFTTRKPLPFFFDQREMYKTLTVTPWLNIVMVWNQGVSFGLFDTNNANMSLVFVGLSLTIALFMLIWLMLSHRKLLSFALSLIVGGAIGNVIDRLRFTAVADFIDVHVNGMHWPAFNIADSCIVVGAILLAADALRPQPKNKEA